MQPDLARRRDEGCSCAYMYPNVNLVPFHPNPNLGYPFIHPPPHPLPLPPTLPRPFGNEHNTLLLSHLMLLRTPSPSSPHPHLSL